MNAIALLKKQHRKVEELFEACKKVEDTSPDELMELCREIENSLAMHATIEEEHFYPACKNVDEDLIREALEEHLGVKRIIADLVAADASDPNFKAMIKVLEEQVKHHVKEEEEELFPKVMQILGTRRLQKLGRTMELAAIELEKEEPRLNVPSETDAPAPI